MNQTVEVPFPLSPKLMLLMTWSQNPRPFVEAPPEAVHGWNMMRAANAERFLYAHIKDKRISAFSAEQKDSRPQIRVDGFGPKKFARTVVVRRLGGSV